MKKIIKDDIDPSLSDESHKESDNAKSKKFDSESDKSRNMAIHY